MNSGFSSCGIDQWEQTCPNGLRLDISIIKNPNYTPQQQQRFNCPVPDYLAGFYGTGDAAPTLLWDDANQVCTSTGSAPYFSVFCDNGVWHGKWINADGSTSDLVLGNPQMDYANGVFTLDDMGSWGSDGMGRCIRRYTFTCA